MRRPFVLITLFLARFFVSPAQETIALPLSEHSGFGPFHAGLGGMSVYSSDDAWRNTQLETTGVPPNWTAVQTGAIQTDYYQFVYQNFYAGKISKKDYASTQQSWNWQPDSTRYSKEPLRTSVAFVTGKNPDGVLQMIIDRNNNLDFSDDDAITPYSFSREDRWNIDSLAPPNTVTITYEQLVNNKKTLVTAPVFVAYMTEYDLFMCNFPRYFTAELEGETVAVTSGGFTELSFTRPGIVQLNDSLRESKKVGDELLCRKNEFCRIGGKWYKNLGVDLNCRTLILEQIPADSGELYSTQIGFKAKQFGGKDVVSKTTIALQALRGKYVLIDFWAVWCAPCREEIPRLKKIYETTDRARFEMVGVVAESSSGALRELIRKNNITWPQIESTGENDIKALYDISGYPTTLLIDPDGIVIARDLRGEALENKIRELIGEP